jgi:pSer/pThr/pTyr-binding forkhead associated (FHA) protein
MPAFIQFRKPTGSNLVVLEGARASIGAAAGNDVVVDFDRTVSRLHASLERFAGGWCVRDLGSRNGTFVNGVRVLGDRALCPGDEVRLGATTFVFGCDDPAGAPLTEVAGVRPVLTVREHDVLVALCAPVLSGEAFTEPASIRDIAAALVVTEAAVKQHLGKLYEKFALPSGDQRRRVSLANEAIRRGVVSLVDLRAAERST